jgi:type I restriction enzyme S subunit
VGYVVEMGVPMATSQDFVNWVCGPELDHRYLKYVLLAEHPHLHRFASGTTHQTIYFPEVKAFHLAHPPPTEQRRIADVLQSFDDKIEVNRRLVGGCRELFLLEFTAWLRSQPDPQRRQLSEVAELVKGVSYRRVDLDPGSPVAMVTLKSVGRGGVYRPDGLKPYSGKYKPSQILFEGDLAVAQTDVTQAADLIGRVIEVGPAGSFETLVASLDLIIVRPASPWCSREFLLGSLLQSSFRRHCLARANGTTVLHLGKDALPTYELSVPDPEEIAAISARLRPLLERPRQAEREVNNLRNLRDALLPKLLSGELRVQDAAEQVEAVG